VFAELADSMRSPVVSPVPDSDDSAVDEVVVEHHCVHAQEACFDFGSWVDEDDQHSGLV
jgi:hypothetical protein